MPYSGYVQHDGSLLYVVMGPRQGTCIAFERITINPEQMGGAPCIHVQRIPMATVIEMLAQGRAPDNLLRAYPDLEQEDFPATLHVASRASVLALFQL